MDAIAFVRRNGGGVAIQLGLCESNGGIGRGGNFRGNGAEDGNGKRSGDGGGGRGGGFLHGEKDEEEGGKKLSTSVEVLKESSGNSS